MLTRPFASSHPAASAACGCCLPRRGFLAAAAAGAATLAGASTTGAATPRDIVDVHAHFTPPTFRTAGIAQGPMVGWSIEKQYEEMDKAGVRRALLSITTPGVTVAGDAGLKLAREANDYGAKVAADSKGRLGLFVYVHRPDQPDAALKDIEYGLDTLKANGVCLFTSYGGKYLGDAVYDPLFAELNRRKAVVYVHPTSAACCARVVPAVPDTVIEFGTDTTRAITSYVYRGGALRFPDVKMIFSHSGGTMPFLIERYDFFDKSGQGKAAAPDGFRAEIAKFYFDIAQAANPVATHALRAVVPTSQIVFGTDYPYRTPIEHVQALEAAKVFDAKELAGVYRSNVARSLGALLA
ncbi:MAG: amidohydrolase family protein [Caulobacteraceae bacterium]